MSGPIIDDGEAPLREETPQRDGWSGRTVTRCIWCGSRECPGHVGGISCKDASAQAEDEADRRLRRADEDDWKVA